MEIFTPKLPMGYANLKEEEEAKIRTEPLTLDSHFVNRQTNLMGHESNDAKDDKSGKETGEAVTHWHNECVPVNKQHRCNVLAMGILIIHLTTTFILFHQIGHYFI